jgi:hypothetical protein
LLFYFFRHNTDRIKNDASNNSLIVACVFVAAVTFFSEPLPSDVKGIEAYKSTEHLEKFIDYVVELGSCAMVYK